MDQKGRTKMKVTTMFAVAALPYAPLALAGNKAACPNEKVVQFVVEKLDVTSLPSAIRPKKEKEKKTSADYGFTARRPDEHEAILEAPGGTRKFSIKILDKQSSGIYVCLAEPLQNGGEAKTQSVFLLKRKDSKVLLKGPESFREFAACPVVGGSDQDSAASAYGGD
jgi:hypothetical protein